MPGKVQTLRKAVGRSSSAGGGAAASFGGPDHRLAQQVAGLWGTNKSVIGKGEVENLFYSDPKAALSAIAAGKAKPAQAAQIAYHLGLIASDLDTTPRQAMEMIQDAAAGKRPMPVHDEDELIAEAQSALKAMGSANDQTKAAKKRDLTDEEWRDEVKRRREAVDASNRGTVKKLKLVQARSTAPDAMTGNGITAPDQGAGKEVVDDAERNKQIDHTQRADDTWQADNDVQPANDGHGAPSRHAAQERVARLQAELAQAEREAAEIDGLGRVVAKLQHRKLTPAQLDELESHIDSFQQDAPENDLYSEAAMDTVSSSPQQEQSITDEDVAAYIERFEPNE